MAAWTAGDLAALMVAETAHRMVVVMAAMWAALKAAGTAVQRERKRAGPWVVPTAAQMAGETAATKVCS